MKALRSDHILSKVQSALVKANFWLLSWLLVWIIQFFVVDELDPYFLSIIIYAGINLILASSLNLISGFTGQFSMGHAGFMSVGAYSAALITATYPSHHPLVFLLSLITGGLCAALAGLLVGLPSLRLKGDYLAIVTLGFGEIIRVIILNLDFVGGARGFPNIAPLTSFGWVYSWALITLFVLWRILQSRLGRAFLSIRGDEIAAECMGVHTTRTKVQAFVIGAFFAGIAGGLFAHYLRYINPQTFDFNRSFEILIMVVLGGMGSLTGSVFAAFLLTGAREGLRMVQEITHIDFRMIIYALMLILLMLVRPYGLLGKREIRDLFLRKG